MTTLSPRRDDGPTPRPQSSSRSDHPRRRATDLPGPIDRAPRADDARSYDRDAASDAGAWWPAVMAAALLCAALAATFPPPARAQIIAAGFVLLCIGLLMRHRHRSRPSRPDGGSAYPHSKE